MPILASLAGLFTIMAALLNWDWFFESAKARFFVNILGRNGARLFYSVIGLVIMGLSLGYVPQH